MPVKGYSCVTARRSRVGARDTPRRRAVAPGSPLSALQVLEHGDVEGLIGDDPLEARVLMFEQLQAFGLLLLEGAVPGPPEIEGLIGDPTFRAAIGTDIPERPPSVLSERSGTAEEMDRFNGAGQPEDGVVVRARFGVEAGVLAAGLLIGVVRSCTNDRGLAAGGTRW